jgi:hypothetical protein
LGDVAHGFAAPHLQFAPVYGNSLQNGVEKFQDLRGAVL